MRTIRCRRQRMPWLVMVLACAGLVAQSAGCAAKGRGGQSNEVPLDLFEQNRASVHALVLRAAFEVASLPQPGLRRAQATHVQEKLQAIIESDLALLPDDFTYVIALDPAYAPPGEPRQMVTVDNRPMKMLLLQRLRDAARCARIIAWGDQGDAEDGEPSLTDVSNARLEAADLAAELDVLAAWTKKATLKTWHAPPPNAFTLSRRRQ